MTSRYFKTTTESGKEYDLHYRVWGEGNPPENTLVCVHGLNGNSGDFKFIGEFMAAHDNRRVVALDVAGRNKSAYYDEADDYNFRQYLKDIDRLLTEIGCTEPSSCDWLGSSLGGLLGFYLAAQDNSPIRRMVINDIGPEVPEADLDLIYLTFSQTASYESFEQVRAGVQAFMTPPLPYSRGIETDAQWDHLIETYYIEDDEGRIRRNMDFKLIHRFKTEPLGEFKTLWNFWEQAAQPVMALRGEYSTLFPQTIAQQMIETKTGASMQLETIQNSGHTPCLYTDAHIKLVSGWLNRSI